MTGGPHSYRDVVDREMHVDELFPDAITGEEVDLRIANAEGRIKFWVVACVAANLVLALPTIFYMGKMAQSVDEMSTSVKSLQASESNGKDWVRDRMVWEAKVEAALHDKGVEVK
jgi:hypothetical protein